MALIMKDACERCQGGLVPTGEAWICTYECTYCTSCTESMKGVCPSCSGELVRRPRPVVK